MEVYLYIFIMLFENFVHLVLQLRQGRGCCVEILIQLYIIVETEIIPGIFRQVAVMGERRHGYDKIELQMGVGRDIGQHAGDNDIAAIVLTEHLSQGVVLSKIFLSHILGDHYAVGTLKSCMRIAFYKSVRENIQESAIREKDPILFKFVGTGFEKNIAGAIHPDGIFYNRQSRLKTLRHP